MHLYEFLVVKFRLQLANGQIVEVPPTLIKRQKQHFMTLEGTGKSLIACTAFVLVKHRPSMFQSFLTFSGSRLNVAVQVNCTDSICHVLRKTHWAYPLYTFFPGQICCARQCPTEALQTTLPTIRSLWPFAAQMRLAGSFPFFSCRCPADLRLEWCHLGFGRNHASSRSTKTQHGLRCSATNCQKCVTS